MNARARCDRYLKIMEWLRKRYTYTDGNRKCIDAIIDGKPTAYTKLSEAFFQRYAPFYDAAPARRMGLESYLKEARHEA